MTPSFPTPWLLFTLQSSQQAAGLRVGRRRTPLLKGALKVLGERSCAGGGCRGLPAEALVAGGGSVHLTGTRGQPCLIRASLASGRGEGSEGPYNPSLVTVCGFARQPCLPT